MPEKSSRRERGGGKHSQPSFGHGRGWERTPLPRRDSRPALPEDAAALEPIEARFWDVVDAGLEELGEELTVGARAAIDAHVRLLVAWNEHINLTALRTPEQLARGHVLDSLSALPLLRALGATVGTTPDGLHALRPPTLLDLGSGGGFPGLPIALVLPASRCALVDSVHKKAAFLEVAARAATAAMDATEARPDLGDEAPEVSAVPARAEELATDATYREKWDIVVARAVGSLAEIVELALPLLVSGGHLVAWKRDADGSLAHELGPARRLARAIGGSRPRIEQADPTSRLGFRDHRLVVVRKIGPTPARFPRPPAERRKAALLP